jgi:hypothetical protein
MVNDDIGYGSIDQSAAARPNVSVASQAGKESVGEDKAFDMRRVPAGVTLSAEGICSKPTSRFCRFGSRESGSEGFRGGEGEAFVRRLPLSTGLEGRDSSKFILSSTPAEITSSICLSVAL